MTSDDRILAILEELRSGQASHAVMLARIEERMAARDAQDVIAQQHRLALADRVDRVEAELDVERGRRKAATVGAGLASIPGLGALIKIGIDLFSSSGGS